MLQGSLEPIYEYGPAATEGLLALIQTLPEKDPRALLDQMFLPTLPAPAAPSLSLSPKKVKRRNRSASVEPSRRSCRQAAKRSVILVTQRATHGLMWQLNLVQAGEPIGDVAMEKFAEMFQGPLAPEATTALRASTRLVNNQLSKAAAAMIEGELAAQVDAMA
jgi:hypothetical protein